MPNNKLMTYQELKQFAKDLRPYEDKSRLQYSGQCLISHTLKAFYYFKYNNVTFSGTDSVYSMNVLYDVVLRYHISQGWLMDYDKDYFTYTMSFYFQTFSLEDTCQWLCANGYNAKVVYWPSMDMEKKWKKLKVIFD